MVNPRAINVAVDNGNQYENIANGVLGLAMPGYVVISFRNSVNQLGCKAKETPNKTSMVAAAE